MAAAPAELPNTIASSLAALQATCGECEQAQATLHCSRCDVLFCEACDVKIHALKTFAAHIRTPAGERPLVCSAHKNEVKAYCDEHGRLVCTQCLRPGGPCATHHAKIKPIHEAVSRARASLEALDTALSEDEKKIKENLASLRAVEVAVQERVGVLDGAHKDVRIARRSVATALALPAPLIINEGKQVVEEVEEDKLMRMLVDLE
jgi:hypothetical protein